MLLLILASKEIFNGITGAVIIWREKQVCGTRWHEKAATSMLYGMLLTHLVWYDILMGNTKEGTNSCNIH